MLVKFWSMLAIALAVAPVALGKATRDFTNFHQPAIRESDFVGPRAIIDGRFKLVLHETRNGTVRRELFDLEADPGETTDLLDRQPDVAESLQTKLRAWQQSVLQSLRGANY